MEKSEQLDKQQSDLKTNLIVQIESRLSNSSFIDKVWSSVRRKRSQVFQSEPAPEPQSINTTEQRPIYLATRLNKSSLVKPQSIKLHYFDLYGRGECIRMLLQHAGVNFEDIRYSLEEFQSKKQEGKFEFNQLPALELDGKFYSQSLSIIRLIGKFYGYYPENAFDAWKSDSLIDLNQDIQLKYWHCFMIEDLSKSNCAFDEYYDKILPLYLECIEKRLIQRPSKSIYLIGSEPTIADFVMCAWVSTFVFNELNDSSIKHMKVVKQFKLTNSYFDKIRLELNSYLSTRQKLEF